MRDPGPQPGPAPLSVSGLTVSYDGRPAVEGAGFTIGQGRLVAVVGPNGAGKSTLIKAVLGLVPAAAGRVGIFGRPIEEMRARVAYVPQRAAVDWDFPASALDVVTMGTYRRIGWFRPIRRRHREIAMQSLESVGLSEFGDRPIGALSGGQQQRVFFARALAQNADLLFLDEPFAGVDATTESIIFARLKELRTAGRSLVVVHHDLDSVGDNFDDVVFINRRVVAAGPVAEVFTPHNLAQTYGARLATALTGLVIG